jgi:hypothetical protein
MIYPRSPGPLALVTAVVAAGLLLAGGIAATPSVAATPRSAVIHWKASPSSKPTSCSVRTQAGGSSAVSVDFASEHYNVAKACKSWIQIQATTGVLWLNTTGCYGLRFCSAKGGEIIGRYVADAPMPPVNVDVCSVVGNGEDAYVLSVSRTGVQAACTALLATGYWTERAS